MGIVGTSIRFGRGLRIFCFRIIWFELEITVRDVGKEQRGGHVIGGSLREEDMDEWMYWDDEVDTLLWMLELDLRLDVLVEG